LRCSALGQDRQIRWALFNRSAAPIDLSGWVITRLGSDGEATEMLRLGPVSMAPSGVFLISNYSDGNARTVLGVTPDLVSSAVSLSNSKLQVWLFDAPPKREVDSSMRPTTAVEFPWPETAS
jgi:hypothetical protein